MISFDRTTQIPVMEHFYTLQGEGSYSGQAAYFIRLAGCDVGCHWCDVKESWTVLNEQVSSIHDIVKQASAYPSRIVVITGGEPLMYDLLPLTMALHQAGFRIHLETSGAYPLSGEIDWICLSPKKFKSALPEILPLAQELKLIIFNKSDLEWAEKHTAMVAPECKLYLQPEWSNILRILPVVIEYIKAHPKWTISLQSHKYIDIP